MVMVVMMMAMVVVVATAPPCGWCSSGLALSLFSLLLLMCVLLTDRECRVVDTAAAPPFPLSCYDITVFLLFRGQRG